MPLDGQHPGTCHPGICHWSLRGLTLSVLFTSQQVTSLRILFNKGTHASVQQVHRVSHLFTLRHVPWQRSHLIFLYITISLILQNEESPITPMSNSFLPLPSNPWWFPFHTLNGGGCSVKCIESLTVKHRWPPKLEDRSKSTPMYLTHICKHIYKQMTVTRNCLKPKQASHPCRKTSKHSQGLHDYLKATLVVIIYR